MKILITVFALLLSMNIYATSEQTAYSRLSDAVGTSSTLISMLNQVITTQGYATFTAIPISGEVTQNVTFTDQGVGIFQDICRLNFYAAN